MVDIVTQRDPLAYSLGANAAPAASIVAGGAGNGVAVTGVTIDRQTIGMAGVAVFATVWEANLTAAKTLSITGLKVEHSVDGTTWVPYVPPYPNTTYTQPGVVALASANGIMRGSSVTEVSLSSAFRYVRYDMTPTLSNTATDTAVLMTHARFGGFSHVPPP